MFDDFELVDVAGVLILILLVASVAIIVVATPEVSQRAQPPDANWTVEMDNESRMEIRHMGGERVGIENLTIIVEEYPRPTEWSGNVSDGSIGEGGYTSIEVNRGQSVALYWSDSEDTVRREFLAGGDA